MKHRILSTRRARLLATLILAAFLSALFAAYFAARAENAGTVAASRDVVKESREGCCGGTNIQGGKLQDADKPHLLAGSYYSVRRGLKATLLLNNKGPQPLEIQPTLYDMTGTRFDLSSVTVEGNSFRLLDMNEWIAIAGASFKEGSLQLIHPGKDLVLGAQIYLTDDEHSFSFDEKLTEITSVATNPTTGGRLDGIWWLPSARSEAQLVVSNVTAQTVAITARFAQSKRKDESEAFSLLPHETRIVDVPQNGRRTLWDARTGAWDKDKGARVDEATNGVTVEYTGAKGGLLARAMVRDERTGYSQTVQFTNPLGGKSARLEGVGLRLSDGKGERFSPVVIARNVGDAATVLKGRIPYQTKNGNTGVVSVPDVRLAPGEMRVVDFTRALKDSGQERNIETASLEFEYTGAPGSVLIAAHTMSRDANQVFRVPMWDPLAQRSPTGGYPWYFEGSSGTSVYLKNVTDREQQYVAHLIYEGGTYMLGLKTLGAHQTVALDIRRLRDEGVPDEAGRVIPPNVTRGQVKWSLKQTDETRANDPFERLAMMGRSEQVDAKQGTSSNYACQNCCSDSFVYGEVLPGSAEMEVGAQAQFAVYDTEQDCYGNLSTYQAQAGWYSNDTNVATVSGGMVTAVGSGETYIRARRRVTEYFSGGGCGGSYRADMADAPDAAEQSSIAARVFDPQLPPPCDPYGCMALWHDRDDSAPITAPPTVTNVTAMEATRVMLVTGSANIIHFVTPKDTSGNNITLTATLNTTAQNVISEIDWEGATESASNPLQATVPKGSAMKNVVKIKYKGSVRKELRVWVVWATITSNDLPIESSRNGTFGIPPTTGTAIRGGYTFTHTIAPATIITDANRPNFSGTNAMPPPGGNHPIFVNDPLSAGANKKWDSSQQIRLKIVSSATINNNDFYQPPFVDIPNYPIDGVEGNDDRTVADEVNDPYTNSGILTDSDRPIYGIVDRAAANGDTYEARLQFRQFTRLEIEGTWTRISDYYLWRIHFRFLKVNGIWTNNGTDKALDNSGF